jgi:hypothetical protein
MIADRFVTRLDTYGTSRHTAQIWRRWDNRFRVVLLERIGSSSRYREIRGETSATILDAKATFAAWRSEIEEYGV